jgi:hypothetical protein
MPQAKNEEQFIPYSLHLEWVSEPACALATKAAFVVWGCALGIIAVRACGHWLLHADEQTLEARWYWPLIAAMVLANIYGLFCDFRIMKLCIVPMVQEVRKLNILGVNVPHRFFIAFTMMNTVLQISTIQMNTWFLASAFWKNDRYLQAWKYLFTHSGFNFMPCQAWNWLTPASVSFLIGVFSATQFVFPLMWFPQLSEALHYLVTHIRLESFTFNSRGFQPSRFEPIYGSILNKVLWTKYPMRIARFEKLFMLATASGLKYTGGFALSYPLKRIADIRDNKRGFQVVTPHGLDVMQTGWELRCLMAFRNLQRNVVTRMFSKLLLKNALQMNLQITLFNVSRAASEEASFHLSTVQDWVEVLNIVGLWMTTLSEVIDAVILAREFRHISRAVVRTVRKIKPDEIYAQPYPGADPFQRREAYTGQDLKDLYGNIWWSVVRMIVLVSVSMVMIIYAVVKFLFSVSCESGLWQEHAGCLNPVPVNYTCRGAE